MVKFKVEEKENFTVVEFELQGPITPEVLKGIKLPKINPQKGVIISGRGPVWLYGFLVHELHPTLWVGCFDPRLGGGVVVATHSPEKQVGDIVPIED